MVQRALTPLPKDFDPKKQGYTASAYDPEQLPRDFDPKKSGYVAIGSDRSWWKEPVPEKLQRIGKAARNAWEAGGVSQVKMFGGIAKAYTEPGKLKWALPGGLVVNLVPGVKERIKDWGDQTVAAADQYFRENPEKVTEIQSSGLLPVIGELLSNPDKLVGAMVENLPLLLEGALATVATGGLGAPAWAANVAGGASMTLPLFGDHYNEARTDGATPNEALARAIVGAPIEAGIEQFTLGKKFGLMRKVMGTNSVRGLKGLAWEINKAYWRGTAEEGTQQFNRNFWRWAFTDRSTDLMSGVIKSASLGGPLEAAYAGVFAGAGFISTPHSARERMMRLDKIRATVEVDDKLGDKAKTEINNTIDIIEEDIIEEQVEVLIERYPQLVEDDMSLAELGNAMAKDFGIDVPIKWKFKKKNKPVGDYGEHRGAYPATGKLDEITINSMPGHDTQRALKETIIHEIGHIVKPPKINKQSPLSRLPKDVTVKEISPGTWRGQKGNTIYAMSSTKQEAAEMALQAINNERQYPRRRSVHHKEFKEWESEAVKVLDPKKVMVAASEVAKVVEEKGVAEVPVKGKETRREMTIEEYLESKGLDPRGTRRFGMNATSEDVMGSAEWQAEAEYNKLKKKGKTPTVEPEAKPTPTERYEAKVPPKKSKKALRYLGHEIPKRNGLTESQLKQDKIRVTKQFSGREDIDSMAKMTREEMENWVAYLESTYGGIEYTKEDLEKPIQVGNRVTTMVSLLREIEETLDKLPARVKIPEHIARGYRRKLEGGRAKQAWDFLVGIDNSNMSTLAWILGGGKDSVFTDIFRDEIARGKKNHDTHIASVYKHVRSELTRLGITDEDLARISRIANPRFTFLDRELMPNLGVETETLTIGIGERKYDITWGNMIDIYLISLQEEGLAHLLGGGLEIEGVETGALTQGELDSIGAEVENNPKAMGIVRLFREIDDNVWKQSLNQTSMRTENKEIATVENWWGLEVVQEKRLPGKREGFNVNLIENKSILKDRTKSSLPLVLRDALGRFDKFEMAIAEYSAMAEPTRTARTVLNHQRIASALKAKGYSRVRSNMLEIMRRAQSTPDPDGSFGKLTRGMLHGAYRAILYFSAKIVASQKTSEIVYSAYTDPKYYPKAAKEALSRKAMDDTLQMSPVAWTRFYMGYSSYELGEVAAQDGVLQGFTGNASWRNKAGLGLKMADLSALTTGMEIAKLEYLDAQNETIEGESAIWWANRRADFKEGSESWRQVVSERAEFLWQQTQPSWDKWNRSRNLSQPKLLIRIASGMLFRSFHEKALNVTQQALIEFQNSPKNNQDYTRASRKVGAVMASYAVNTIIRATILALMTGKVKEPWEYLTELSTSPFSMITFLGRQFQQTIQNFVRVAKGEKVKFYGKIGEQLPFSIVQTLTEATNNFATGTAFYLRGDERKGEDAYKKALKQTYESIGLLQGIPIYELRRVTERLKPTKKSRKTY